MTQGMGKDKDREEIVHSVAATREVQHRACAISPRPLPLDHLCRDCWSHAKQHGIDFLQCYAGIFHSVATKQWGLLMHNQAELTCVPIRMQLQLPEGAPHEM